MWCMYSCIICGATCMSFDVHVSTTGCCCCCCGVRFVQRLPPVLGYDVDTNLKPKWDFLVNTLRLTTFDVSRFPAYFSYPLEKVTMPRMAYLAAVNQPNAVWGLNLILTPSDDIFATKVTPVFFKIVFLFHPILRWHC